LDWIVALLPLCPPDGNDDIDGHDNENYDDNDDDDVYLNRL
jgi:hypothetical protein